MFKLRFYDQTFHPDQFKGAGFRGWVIRVLNWVRWQLETVVQRTVLRHLSRVGHLSPMRAREMDRAFDLDVAAERLEKERTSPLYPSTQSPEAREAPTARSERYAAGAQRSALDAVTEPPTDAQGRGRRLDNLVGQYGADMRAKRYAHGRRYLVGDPDGDFETVDPPAVSVTPVRYEVAGVVSTRDPRA